MIIMYLQVRLVVLVYYLRVTICMCTVEEQEL